MKYKVINNSSVAAPKCGRTQGIQIHSRSDTEYVFIDSQGSAHSMFPQLSMGDWGFFSRHTISLVERKKFWLKIVFL